MATYIQGVTDYIPELQPFQPDFNMLANVLQTKQSRYDAAHKQLSSVYGTLLNSPMLRQENIDSRDQFFKSIDQEIQRMSGIDLSLQQNQTTAMDVFKGLYEDKNVVKDMMWTKNYMNELNRADAFKSCVDPKKCGGSWWEGGVKALNYKAQEFKNTSTEDALNFSDASYVAAQDFTEDALKLAKDSGFEVKFDEVKGDWIVTTKNGKEMIQPLADFYLSRYGNDGKIVEFYKTRAYLNRMDWVTANLSNYADANEANMAYISNLVEASKRQVTQGKQEASEAADIAKTRSQRIDKTIKEQGYIPSMNWLEGWREDKEEVGSTEQTLQVYDDADNNLKALGINRDNVRFAVDNFDSVMGFNMLRETTYNVAEGYARLNQEVTIKENPYAVQAKAQAFQSQRAREKEGYVETDPVTGQKRYVWGTDMYQKYELKRIEEEEKKRAAAELAKTLTTYTPKDFGGTATTAVDLNKAYRDNLSERNKLVDEKGSLAKQYVLQGIGAAQRAYQTNKMNPKAGASLYELSDVAYGILGRGNKYGIKPQALIAGDKKAVADFEKLLEDPAIVNQLYANTKTQFDPTSGSGALNNSWVTEETRTTLSQYEKDFNLKDQFVKAHTDFSKKQSELAITLAQADLSQKQNTEDEDDWKEMDNSFRVFKQVYDKNNIDGFLGDDPAKSPTVEKALRDIATERVNNFKKNDPKGYLAYNQRIAARQGLEAVLNTSPFRDFGAVTKLATEAGKYVNPSLAAISESDSLEKITYDDVVKEYQQGYKMWRDAYSDKGASWTNPKGLKATDVAAHGYSGVIDSGVSPEYSQSNMDFMDMIQNYNALRDEAKIYYGNIENTGERYRDGEDNDEGARDILDQVIRDFPLGGRLSKEGLPMNEDRVAGGFDIVPIAGGDEKTMAFRIVPSKTWGKPYRSAEGKSDKLIDDDRYADEGIVVYMPKDKMQSDYLRRSVYDEYDFVMENTGQLKIENPMAGDITIKKEGNMYALYMNLLEYDSAGNNISKAAEPTYHDLTLDLADLYATFSQNLDYNALLNRTALSNVAQQYKGDPNQILYNNPAQQ